MNLTILNNVPSNLLSSPALFLCPRQKTQAKKLVSQLKILMTQFQLIPPFTNRFALITRRTPPSPSRPLTLLPK